MIGAERISTCVRIKKWSRGGGVLTSLPDEIVCGDNVMTLLIITRRGSFGRGGRYGRLEKGGMINKLNKVIPKDGAYRVS